MSVDPHRSAARSAFTAQPEILMSVRIDNYRHIALSHGDEAADAAREHAEALVRRLFNCRIIVPNGKSSFDAFVAGELISEGEGGDGSGRGDFSALMQSFQAVIAETPFLHGGREICVAVSAVACAPEPSDEWEGCDVRLLPVAREALAAKPFGGELPRPTPFWAATYCADMDAAGALLRAMSAHEIFSGWRPVVRADGSGGGLYSRVVPRLIDDAGHLVSGEAGVRAAERIGLARHVDRHMVALVLEALAADPLATLAVEISAQSACSDGWWRDVGCRLDRDGDLARRLVIEISGASPITAMEDTIAFVAAMRGRGCQVALQDFGSSHASVRTLLALAPDIVKIDAAFVRLAAGSAKWRAVFSRVTGLAAALSGMVVVEGVDSPALLAIAREEGVQWVQGDGVGDVSSQLARATAADGFGAKLVANGYADFASPAHPLNAAALNSVTQNASTGIPL